MRLPNGEVIRHAGEAYDPAKAHEYYMRTRKLKGRKKGSGDDPTSPRVPAQDPQARKQQLAQRIENLEGKLTKLNVLIREKKAALKRSQKEQAKPDTAAEKADKARDAKKYRDKHKQELKTKAKRERGKGGGGDKKTDDSDKSIKELESLAIKVKGQLAVAKQRLRAL